MRFDSYLPYDRLKPYIMQFVISEASDEQTHKILPDTSLVLKALPRLAERLVMLIRHTLAISSKRLRTFLQRNSYRLQPRSGQIEKRFFTSVSLEIP